MPEDMAGLGHNNPPPDPATPAAVLDLSIIQGVKDAARVAIQGLKDMKRPIETVDEAEAMNDAISRVAKVAKDAEAARVKAKKPFDDAAKEVQAIFKTPEKTGLIDLLDKFIAAGKAEVGVFQRAEQERADAEAEARRAAARKAEEDAFAAKQLAEAKGDDFAVAEAEAAAAAAAKNLAKIEKADTTVRIGSATGEAKTMAVRTTKTAKITNYRAVVLHFINDPEVADLMQKLANRAVRAADYVAGSVPGVEIETDTKIV